MDMDELEIMTKSFFERWPDEYRLYERFQSELVKRHPDVNIKVQKSQIAFANRYNFAFAWLPYGRMKKRPEHYIIISFGLSHALSSPRIEQKSEPYPNRWTHHVLIMQEEDLDDELFAWIEEAYTFSAEK